MEQLTPQEMLEMYRKSSPALMQENAKIFNGMVLKDRLELIWYQMAHFAEAVKTIVAEDAGKRFEMSDGSNVGRKFQ